jgi:hypothetical protein
VLFCIPIRSPIGGRAISNARTSPSRHVYLTPSIPGTEQGVRTTALTPCPVSGLVPADTIPPGVLRARAHPVRLPRGGTHRHNSMSIIDIVGDPA